MNPGGTARRVFTEEARDLLIDLEEALLELESHPGDAALMARVFRALHTLKGTGAMFGFDAVARFTHAVEDLFDNVRKAGVPATSELLALGLDAKDHLQELLERGASAPVEEKTPAADRAEDGADADVVAARERELLDRIGGLAERWAAPAVAPDGFPASSGVRGDDAVGAAEASPTTPPRDFHMAASGAIPASSGHMAGLTPPEPSAVPAGSPREPQVYWLRYTPSPDALRRGDRKSVV